MLEYSFILQVIYFPMNLDFRGRVYPIPPHLNHLGNELCCVLFAFSRKQLLGERGLFWLKIQVANLYGNDKVITICYSTHHRFHLMTVVNGLMRI